jgi:hypothetical protein
VSETLTRVDHTGAAIGAYLSSGTGLNKVEWPLALAHWQLLAIVHRASARRSFAYHLNPLHSSRVGSIPNRVRSPHRFADLCSMCNSAQHLQLQSLILDSFQILKETPGEDFRSFLGSPGWLGRIDDRPCPILCFACK